MTLLPAEQALDPLVGSTLAGKYLVQARLGEGGMGIVYRAMHLGLDHPVALKVLKHALLEQTANVERLRREARTIARLKSEHTVQVLDVGQLDSGCPYIVMEYLQGEDLGAVLERDGPLSLRDAIDCALSVIEALEEAHVHGIVHRDLKPENLFITRPRPGFEVLKLLDFGIATTLAPAQLRLTQPKVAVGSPQYMAPEQVLAAARINSSVDVWGLGVTLYELTTGELPFDGGSLGDVCAAIVHATPRPPSAVRGELWQAFDALVLDCLRKDPAERPSLAELADRLRRCRPCTPAMRGHQPSVTGLAHTITQQTRGGRRSWWPYALAIGSVVLGGLGWIGAQATPTRQLAASARVTEPPLSPHEVESVRDAPDQAPPALTISPQPSPPAGTGPARVFLPKAKPVPKPAPKPVVRTALPVASVGSEPASALPDFGGRY